MGDLSGQPVAGLLGISAVERDTGLNKETLRAWERRYGFPQPLRNPAGERLYPADQVQRLRLLKRLLDAGHRPGRVVAASDEDLDALLLQPRDRRLDLLGSSRHSAPATPGLPAEVAPCLDLLKAHEIEGLRALLTQTLLRMGLSAGVQELLAPMTREVGEIWMRGELQVFEEHMYSEVLQQVLRQAMQTVSRARLNDTPRVLLSTLPGEQHGLGLLMAEALLSLEGAHCLSLGVQTPTEQLVRAATAHRAHVLALSFSGYLNPRLVQQGLASLREMLPPEVEIWAGGSARALQQVYPGVVCLPLLSGIAPAVARWRAVHPI